MTLDYIKMFLIVTEEAVVKGHFDFTEISLRKGRFFIARRGNLQFAGKCIDGHCRGDYHESIVWLPLAIIDILIRCATHRARAADPFEFAQIPCEYVTWMCRTVIDRPYIQYRNASSNWCPYYGGNPGIHLDSRACFSEPEQLCISQWYCCRPLWNN